MNEKMNHIDILSNMNIKLLWDIVNSSAQSILITDVDGSIIYVNDYFIQVTGYTSKELIGKNPNMWNCGIQSKEVYSDLWETIESGQIWSGQLCNKTKSGKVCWHDATIYPIQDQHHTYYLAIYKDITAEVEARKQLQEAQATLRNMIDAVTESLVMIDRDGQILVANKTMADRFGTTPKLITQQRIQDILPPDILDNRLEIMNSVIESGQSMIDVDSRFGRHMESLYYPVFDEDGEVNRIVGFGRDITAEVKARETLHQNEERHQIILGNISDAVFLTDDEGNFTYICPNASNIFGFNPYQIQSFGNIKNLLCDVNFDERLFNRHNEITNIETEITDANGAIHNLLVNIKKVKINGGTHLYTCRDITDLEHAKQDLDYHSMVLSSVSDAVILTDMQFNVISLNPAAENIYGWRTAEVKGKSWGEIVPIKFLRQPIHEVIPTLYQHGIWSGEVVQTCRNGQKIHVASSITIVKDSRDNPIGFVAINRDITRQHELQQQATQAQILEAELKKERELSNLKERLMSIVSHEFRTPLTVMQISADLLNRHFDQLDEEKRRKHLDRIVGQIKYAVKLLDDTMQLRHAQSGHVEFTPSQIDLEMFCMSIFDQMQFADNHRHPMQFMVETCDNRMLADANLLEHIIQNLLSNAIKYTPDGKSITMCLNQQADEMILKVVDEGIGIPQQDLKRLFEPYHRASNVNDIQGTGLGLAIVKEYVELHGGTITCESQIDVGTQFTVRLPNMLSNQCN